MLNPPLHRATTFVTPLSDQKNDQDAQLSPKPRKFCLRPLCLLRITKTTVMSHQIGQRRQSGDRTMTMVAQRLPWSPNGSTLVAAVIAQWTLFIGLPVVGWALNYYSDLTLSQEFRPMVRSHWLTFLRQRPVAVVIQGPTLLLNHDDVIKWKRFPRYWLFVRGIHRSPVNSSHKG